MCKNKKGALAVSGAAIAIFFPGALTFGYPGVMAPIWEDMFNVGSGAVGNTMFYLLAAVGIFMFVVGRLQELIGIRHTIILGVIICSLSMLVLTYAQNIYHIYLWAFSIGMGGSFIYIPSLTSVQMWFTAKKGLFSGIVSFMFGFSAAVMSPIFGKLLAVIGYHQMNILLGVVTLLIGLIAAYFTDITGKNKSMDLIKKNFAYENQFSLRSLNVKESIRTKAFWLLWIIWALQGAAGISMVTLSVGFGLSKEFPINSAILILTSFNVTNGLSRLITGYLSDRVGRNLTMSFSFLLAGCAYFLMPYANMLFIITICAVIIGFSFGTLFAVSAPLVSDYFGLKHFGSIFGLIFTAYGFFASLIGPTLGGYVLEITEGNYAFVFSYLGMFSIISAFLIRLITPPK